MKHQEVIKVLNAEILFHKKNHGGSHCGESYENGFISGLKQARSLIRKIANAENKQLKSVS